MIISDASPMVGFLCAMDRRQSVPYAIEAGCDMLLFNKDYEEDLGYMRQGYAQGILSEERLDEAVTRILAAKAALKLHEKQRKGALAPGKEGLSVIACDQHKAWAKE
ncbi:MAG: glycoside hydrolase family 3 protein, partial [Clostridia bacterium]|nr:glycoside hydrolase family 3 protein [Clostridia bacterium]